jgi:hypothetical protein
MRINHSASDRLEQIDKTGLDSLFISIRFFMKYYHQLMHLSQLILDVCSFILHQESRYTVHASSSACVDGEPTKMLDKMPANPPMMTTLANAAARGGNTRGLINVIS